MSPLERVAADNALETKNLELSGSRRCVRGSNSGLVSGACQSLKKEKPGRRRASKFK